MILRSPREISSPLWRLSSIKVLIPYSHKALYKWLIKPRRVFYPLKLRETSKFLFGWVEEEDGDEDEPPLLVTRAIEGIFEHIVVKIWKEKKENYEKAVNMAQEIKWMSGMTSNSLNFPRTILMLFSLQYHTSFHVKPKINLHLINLYLYLLSLSITFFSFYKRDSFFHKLLFAKSPIIETSFGFTWNKNYSRSKYYDY